MSHLGTEILGPIVVTCQGLCVLSTSLIILVLDIFIWQRMVVKTKNNVPFLSSAAFRLFSVLQEMQCWLIIREYKKEQ